MKNILAALKSHARERPNAVAVELVSRRKPTGRRSFREILERAGNAAAAYAARDVSKGDIVVLIGTHHLDFYAAWLGAVWIGAIPTVLAEPSVRIDRAVYAERLEALLLRVDAKVLAVDPSAEVDNPVQIPTLAYDAAAEHSGDTPAMVEPDDKDLLLLQHSSGTTGLQKGVMLSHGAVARHSAAYISAVGATHEDVVASWLPLYHDMGLIACFVTPLFAGAKVVWLSPFEWVSSPALLLEAIESHQATLSWLPNFAFPFLAQRTRAEPDLSSLRAIVNCSEPVSEEAMQTFAKRFATFDESALHACFALAENVFAVTTSTADEPRRVLKVVRKVWLEEHRAEDGGDLELVSNGVCIEGCEVKIVDEAGAEVPARAAGRLLIRSPFLFDGYFRREDLNVDLFADGWFDTGDVGFVDERSHLYVTGRKKDLIIVGGRNVYPQDVEQVANEVPGVYPGRVVCFGVTIPKRGTEALVLLAESDTDEASWKELSRSIKRQTASRLDLDLTDARIVPRKTLRKSTSGKLARAGNRSWYLEGRFGPIPKTLGDGS